MDHEFDLVTIGAGSGGVAASRRAAAVGAKVAILEADRVGGTCVLRGCVPKKLLAQAAGFTSDFVDAAGFGFTVGTCSHDWAKLIAAKDRELARLESVYTQRLREAGVEIVHERGTLAGPHIVRTDTRELTTRHVLVATGSRPSRLAVPGIDLAISSDEALSLPAVPARLVILGGGYVAVELGSVFRAFGSEVHMVLRGDRLLRGFDHAIADALADALSSRGVHIHRERRVLELERWAGAVAVRLEPGESLFADTVLCASGREPSTFGLGLEALGVALGKRGAIVVDEWSTSTVPSVHAVGDVTDRVALTPVAIAEARALVATLFERRPTPITHEGIPTAVFANPPIGAVGLSEEGARARGRVVDVYEARFLPLRATLSGRTDRTFVKVVVDRDSDRVLGMHMLGPDAPEIIQGFAAALRCGLTKTQLDHTIGIHPTSAEEFVTLRTKRE